MKASHLLLAVAALVCGAVPGAAEMPAAPPFTPPEDLRGGWAFEPDPDLPDVLILGDSISIGYTRAVRGLLRGRANVFRPMARGGRAPANCGDTPRGLENLDAWLGEREWDVIHFNWGLWDLCYRHPESNEQGQRDKVNGTLSTPPADYRKNLDELVTRMNTTGARLIWASTTMVPEGEAGRFVGDDVKYNAIAAEVMLEHGVPTNDLHAITREFPAVMFTKPGDVHFTAAAYERLAEQVAAEISKALKHRQASETP